MTDEERDNVLVSIEQALLTLVDEVRKIRKTVELIESDMPEK